MRILVTGGNGQLGNELQRILREGRSEIGPIPDAYAGAEIVAADVDELDVTDADAVMAYVTQGGFDLIVNGAAMTNVDGCETAEDAAFRVNAEAPGNLARAAEAVGAKLVQVSTDYVFPGTEPEPRVEDDPTGPVSAYGRTKLAGEERSLAACSRCFVVRTAWLYGRGRRASRGLPEEAGRAARAAGRPFAGHRRADRGHRGGPQVHEDLQTDENVQRPGTESGALWAEKIAWGRRTASRTGNERAVRRPGAARRFRVTCW